MRTSSNRALARHIGVSETAVRRAEEAGRIRREPDGAWDLARVQAAWSSNTDRAQQRRQHSALKPVPEAALGAVRETCPWCDRRRGRWSTAATWRSDMTTVAELEARVEALKAQRDSAVARFPYDGRSVEYRGTAEIAGR